MQNKFMLKKAQKCTKQEDKNFFSALKCSNRLCVDSTEQSKHQLLSKNASFSTKFEKIYMLVFNVLQHKCRNKTMPVWVLQLDQE